MAKETKFRPATMAEIEDRDTDLYMNGERVWVFMIHRSGSIGEEEHKLDYITLTNMKKVQPEDLQVIDDTPEDGETKETTSETNDSNSETMAKEMKGADLIGKVLVLGDGNSKYVIKSVDGDKLSAEFSRGEGAGANVSLTVAQVESMISAGKAAWSDGEPDPEAVGELVYDTTSASVEEVEEVSAITPTKPVATTVAMEPTTKPKPKNEKPKAKSEGRGKKEDGRGKKEEAKGGRYIVQLMTSKKGRQWPKLYGFGSEDEAKAMADRMGDGISASWDYGMNDEGRESKTRHWHLKAFPKYCDVIQQLCDALNRGDKAAIDKAVKASKEWKARRAERKANENANENEKPAGYSDKDVAEMLKKIMAGEAIPENIKAAMAA